MNRWPRLVAAHACASMLELLRQPGYVVPTLVFPAMFFLFFAAPAPASDVTVLMCSFAAFAVIGVGFFQFGIAAANDRISPWETYLRTLPVRCSRPLRRPGRGRGGLRRRVCPDRRRRRRWRRRRPGSIPQATRQLSLVLLGALVPFALLGIALGYWTTPRSALPIANLLYLVLSYAGGLWMTPGRLPDVGRTRVDGYCRHGRSPISSARSVSGFALDLGAWARLAGFAAVFGASAVARLPARRGAALPLSVPRRFPPVRLLDGALGTAVHDGDPQDPRRLPVRGRLVRDPGRAGARGRRGRTAADERPVPVAALERLAPHRARAPAAAGRTAPVTARIARPARPAGAQAKVTRQ